ncbi:MAG: hypothetical protein RLZ98_560 [Pseudomonadota bacterium]|jgi:thiamine-monophosphate kinase
MAGDEDAQRVRGEEALIREFLAPLTRDAPGALGLSDDCALLSPEPGREFVLKTDPVIAGVHFFADDGPGDIAWKALAVNVSDLAAKSARPESYLMALTLPEPPERQWMKRFAAGLDEAQRAFGCCLIGGDTDRSPASPLTISITVFGSVPVGGMVRRGGAKPGDGLYVSGSIGDAALGLRLRQGEHLEGLGEGDRALLLQRYLRPNPRLQLRQAIRKHASAAMDLSDGLVKDAGRMARSSCVDIVLEAGRVPFSNPARRLFASGNVQRDELLVAGDDYEVLVAVPEQQSPAFEAAAKSSGVAVHRVGMCHNGNGLLCVKAEDGRILDFARPGWDHLD